jgi:hypothetical protein
MRLQQARLAVATDAADAAALLESLPQRPRHGNQETDRALRWQADALRAGWRCRQGDANEGRALHAQVLADAQRLAPERARLRRRLAMLGAPCS